jgi:hypothetical protein
MLAMGLPSPVDFTVKHPVAFTSDIIGCQLLRQPLVLHLMLHLHWLKLSNIIFSSCSRICSLNGMLVISTVEGEHTAAGFTTVNIGNGFTVTSTDFTVKHPVANSLLIGASCCDSRWCCYI